MSPLLKALPKWLKKRLDAPVAIFGRASSGQAASALLEGLGCECHVFDERAESESMRSFGLQEAKNYKLVVCSPGFAVEHPWLQAAREAGCEILPELDLGACLWRGPIVVITGTNGKTTLTEFLTSAFSSAGIEAYACGNIGRPISSLIADDFNLEAIAVCEVSSFQAELTKHLHADSLLWTNFAEDHLDRHKSLRSYFESKYSLVKLQRGDICLFDESVQSFAEEFGCELPEDGLVDHSLDAAQLGVTGTIFETLPERNTYLIARALWLRMGLDEGELIEAANNFKKSPHRMELIENRNGVSYWDDSKSTNFHAVYGALKRFENPVIWIGGGKNKGGDLPRFVANLAPRIQSAHLIGETSIKLAPAFEEHGVPVRVYEDLDDAVAGASAVAESGSNILLSPGFASLDMFDGYSQRGEAFRRAISHLSDL
ncbi:UDP-N-acetylmuramoyl-L-alanine--D-glutamate ligase [Pelagicoccus sp. SDUM812005]|uniref:UDP-N-acetylmuramoyl-L-alanine--D-glutamate ligase n=1 Tax=Pelagicoccus sp. SDUM812005 TaxID=3041257 RepID=UPI00280D63E7|nr:UDP-N-acetylmuramoyl-L-alanine--D-glutamate ligase [Pelagicoccus sp. SDUM812005]MDQ8180582.1 UDP-N-acetylmuramoyl-L-alanine--D-glutamate ligase [Pelagicoccus sp. SDUM812005]